MTKKIVILLFFLLMTHLVRAQIGGLRSFEFLEIPKHAKVAGLGTVNISAGSGDINMVNQNPALLDSLMDNEFSLTIAPYFADIVNTQINYAKNFKKVGIFQFGLFYQGFGSFKGYDNTGQPTADFNAANYLFSVAHSRQEGVFSYGINMKLASTQLIDVQTTALLFDLGGIFKHPTVDFTAGLTINNIGFYLKKEEDETRNLPFDIQIGSSFKPEFMPFRFSLTLNRLYQYDISYFQPVIVDENDPFLNTVENAPSSFDKLFQHVTIGTELILGENLSLRAGYNHLIRQSLKRSDIGGAGGFTFGINFQTKKINLAYSNAIYQVASAAHFITVGTNFNAILKRKTS